MGALDDWYRQYLRREADKKGDVKLFIWQALTGILFVYDLCFILSRMNIFLNPVSLGIIVVVAAVLTQVTSDAGAIIKLISFIATIVSPFYWFILSGIFNKVMGFIITYGVLIVIAVISYFAGYRI